jgi:hypothetical protein
VSSCLPPVHNAAFSIFTSLPTAISRLASYIVCHPIKHKSEQLESTESLARNIMASLEPIVITYPLFRTDIYTATTRAGSTLTTLAAKVVPTPTMTTAATDFPALLQTSTGIPPLPLAFDSPLATGKDHTPAVAIITLVMVIISALFLFVAFCYFIFLRFRGKCPQCPQYEDELKKWKNGSLKPITREMVYNRPHNCDLEKGVDVFDEKDPFDDQVSPSDAQAKQYKALQRAQSLASLEGRASDRVQENKTIGDRALRHLRNSQLRAAKVQRDSGWSSNVATIHEDEEPKDLKKEKPELKRTALEFAVEEPVPAHLPRPTARDESTLVNDPALPEPNFKGTYEEYERDVLAERRRQKVALSIAGWYDVANDPNASEARQQRALAMASAKMAEIDKHEAQTKGTTAAPRDRGQSRFQERFSLATQSYHGSI